MSAVDQFLFGYDDGHCLLTGSRQLPSAIVVRLLGATDAAPAPDSGPLVTGLALRETEEFAFCVTWSAPEAPRPGAVWAHALIIGQAQLRDARAFEVLLGLPRRPSADGADLGSYTVSLPLEDAAPASPSYLAGDPLDLGLLANLVSAAYAPRGERIVAQEDLAAATNCLLALWRAQWPELRAAFSFRTREVIAAGASDYNLTVARKIRGRGGHLPAAARAQPPWVRALVADAAAPTHTRLREFLWTYGPAERRDPRRVRVLTALWLRVAAGDAPQAREWLERHWPRPQSGAALKRALFGRENNDWWSLDEPSRVSALLQATKPAWDFDELELANRVRALADAGRLSGRLSWLAEQARASLERARRDRSADA